jgi:hypothetical protein
MVCLTGLVAVLMSGCETRSISDSGYRSNGSPNQPWMGRAYLEPREPFGYRGELSEFDVLGIERGGNVTEEQIAKTLDSALKIGIRKGSTVMLIQSGAFTPDEPMQSEMSKCFTVMPFDGRPDSAKGPSYARSLRMAAAQAGCETIICYWGTLETAKRELGTKIVSWVPVVGGILPDENQQMRIRLKVAVINVRGGNWTEFSPDTFDNALASGVYNRGSSDQTQVLKLKRQAYESAARDLVKIYAN